MRPVSLQLISYNAAAQMKPEDIYVVYSDVRSETQYVYVFEPRLDDNDKPILIEVLVGPVGTDLSLLSKMNISHVRLPSYVEDGVIVVILRTTGRLKP